ncbi:MAG: hypothetical protein AB7E61_06305 [Acholeplasmataceae bacterium]
MSKSNDIPNKNELSDEEKNALDEIKEESQKRKYVFEEKSNTHIVIKRDDVLNLILASDAALLGEILQKIEDARYEAGKKINQSYIVVNRDEPYADTIMGIIAKGEEMKHHKQTCRVCGCDDLHSCKGGCYWVEEDLCSQCSEKMNMYYIRLKKVSATDSDDDFITVDDFEELTIAEEVSTREEYDAFIAGYFTAMSWNSEFEIFVPGDIYYEVSVFNYLNEIQDQYYAEVEN